MPDLEFWPGRPYPLGATFDGTGTNFALFTEVAEAVELCLFDDEGHERKVPLDEGDAFSWHAYLPHVWPRPRCSCSERLLDPYARASEGQVRCDQACYAYDLGDESSVSNADSAPYVSRS